MGYVNGCDESTAELGVRVLQLSVVLVVMVRLICGTLQVCLAGTVNILVENVLVEQLLLSFRVIVCAFHGG